MGAVSRWPRRGALLRPARPVLAGLGALALGACSLPGTASGPPSPAASPSPVASAPAPSGQAKTLQDQFVAVVKAARPAVVQIQTTQGLGSGVIFDNKGDVVTNAHVVGAATTFQVTLADGHQYGGTLVGVFREDDLAVIRISGQNLTVATFADSSSLQVGQIVMAIGNPLALQSSVTEGIISALGRTQTEPAQGGVPGTSIPDMIQTSAAINPGNSGGALVDLQGRVVGIPTLAATDQQVGGGQAPGIGFAISGNMATDIAGQLIAHGHVVNSHRAFLGVAIGGDVAGGGVYVGQVTQGGPAAAAGIRAGDVITSVDGQQTPDFASLSQVLANLRPGQKVKVGLTHQDGSQSTVTVTLGSFPGNS
ncbi:MAG: S1C family serine protease [Candidatus Dormibacterales bacterium]